MISGWNFLAKCLGLSLAENQYIYRKLGDSWGGLGTTTLKVFHICNYVIIQHKTCQLKAGYSSIQRIQYVSIIKAKSQ